MSFSDVIYTHICLLIFWLFWGSLHMCVCVHIYKGDLLVWLTNCGPSNPIVTVSLKNQECSSCSGHEMECFGSLSLVLEVLRSCWSSVYTGIPKDEVWIPGKEQLSNRLMNLPTRGQAGKSKSSHPPGPFISFYLFYFTLYRFFVNITPCTQNPLSSMSLHIHLATSPQKENKG